MSSFMKKSICFIQKNIDFYNGYLMLTLQMAFRLQDLKINVNKYGC